MHHVSAQNMCCDLCSATTTTNFRLRSVKLTVNFMSFKHRDGHLKIRRLSLTRCRCAHIDYLLKVLIKPNN